MTFLKTCKSCGRKTQLNTKICGSCNTCYGCGEVIEGHIPQRAHRANGCHGKGRVFPSDNFGILEAISG